MYVSSPQYILYNDSLYPGVNYVLRQNILRGIKYPRGVYSVLGQNIPRGMKYPRTKYTRVYSVLGQIIPGYILYGGLICPATPVLNTCTGIGFCTARVLVFARPSLLICHAQGFNWLGPWYTFCIACFSLDLN
jgi:hypothetical protein